MAGMDTKYVAFFVKSKLSMISPHVSTVWKTAEKIGFSNHLFNNAANAPTVSSHSR